MLTGYKSQMLCQSGPLCVLAISSHVALGARLFPVYQSSQVKSSHRLLVFYTSYEEMGLRPMSPPATVAHSLQLIPFKGCAPQRISWHNSLHHRGVNYGQWPRPVGSGLSEDEGASTLLCPLNLTVSLMLSGTVIILRWNSSFFSWNYFSYWINSFGLIFAEVIATLSSINSSLRMSQSGNFMIISFHFFLLQ